MRSSDPAPSRESVAPTTDALPTREARQPTKGLPASAPPSSAPAETEPVRCSETHTVQPADGRRFVRHRTVPRETLAQVAHRYDVPPWKLREWNGIADDVERVRRGTRLRVKAQRVPPSRERIEYTVRENDTWWKVAVSHGVDSMDLRAYNWPYRDKMTPGQTLQIWIDPIVYDWVQSTPGGPLSSMSSVRPGAVGVGPPNDGSLVNGVRIPEGPGYRLRFPKSAYGTTHAVTQFVRAMDRFSTQTDYPRRIAVGTMSRQRGGRVGSHESHQTGRDLDVRLPRRADIPRWWGFKPSRIDWHTTWTLVRALAETDVEVIFVDYRMQRRLYKAAKASGASEEERARLIQYPRGSHARLGLVRHEPGHDKHMHVRFGCGPCEVECVARTATGPERP